MATTNKITDSLLLINATREMYPDDTGQYLFKSCGEWIVVMEKTGNTITNQSRLPDDDPCRPFAKYRANELKVIKIIHKFDTNKTTDRVYSTSFWLAFSTYIEGNIVVPDSFDEDLSKVCTNGIHFYETIDCAFYLMPYSKANGKWIYRYDNGEKHLEGEYINGKKHGVWTAWYENGQKMVEVEYSDGKECGKCIDWYEDGHKKSEGIYVNGKQHGMWTYWDDNGQIMNKTKYENGL